MSIHDRVKAKIEQGVPCYAQATISGQLVSMHPGFTGFDMTFSGGLYGKDQDMSYVRAVMIDLWVQGKAAVSRETFSAKQLEWRAHEHETGNGPDILPGDRDADFAKKIRDFVTARGKELATEPCPH